MARRSISPSRVSCNNPEDGESTETQGRPSGRPIISWIFLFPLPPAGAILPHHGGTESDLSASITAGGNKNSLAPATAKHPTFASIIIYALCLAMVGRLFKRLRKLGRTPPVLASGTETYIDPETLETRLLLADVGVTVTAELLAATHRITGRSGTSADIAGALRDKLIAILKPVERPLEIDPGAHPYVILMVGVNGSGKTTTTAKLTRRLSAQGRQVVLAAGDTFRAAAVEQLQQWGRRLGVTVIAQQSGADAAAVAFDAWQAAHARGSEILIIDTAGRLHTQDHLLAELAKMRRVIARQDPAAPHEVLLVLDATIGQNALLQARRFTDEIGVTGLAITKLDGSAKGGVLVAIARELALPIRFVGIGENSEDLEPFVAQDYANALLGIETTLTP